MHSFKASNDLLISAPSNLVCLSAELDTAPRSLPARSIRENFPERGVSPSTISSWNVLIPYNGRRFVPVLRIIWNTAWLLEEFEFAEVLPEVRRPLPRLMRARTSSTEATSVSVSPTTTTLRAQLSQVKEETFLVEYLDLLTTCKASKVSKFTT